MCIIHTYTLKKKLICSESWKKIQKRDKTKYSARMIEWLRARVKHWKIKILKLAQFQRWIVTKFCCLPRWVLSVPLLIFIIAQFVFGFYLLCPVRSTYIPRVLLSGAELFSFRFWTFSVCSWILKLDFFLRNIALDFKNLVCDNVSKYFQWITIWLERQRFFSILEKKNLKLMNFCWIKREDSQLSLL